MEFVITSAFKPTGDQPSAIEQLTGGLRRGDRAQTLLGVTGSGKTFTIANVIQQVQRPTLVLSHNKTLVAQLYGELRQFFPQNAVEFFVSYYDYYQPEAYLPVSDMYIEKDLSINEEVEKLRLKTTSSLLSGRRDVVVVASVSCIFGMGNPSEYKNRIIRISRGDMISRNSLLLRLVESLYSRSEYDFKHGTFRVRGDSVDINLPYADHAVRLIFFGDEIEKIELFDPVSGRKIDEPGSTAIFPANIYVTPKDEFEDILGEIQAELDAQVKYFDSVGKALEAKRLRERVNYDLEMLRELGYCSGIENYSRFLDRRRQGERPFCLMDYFPDDYLLVVDESHVTIPQVRGMYGGDRSRKLNLVDYGFRIPSALDNRPLTFAEFEGLVNQVIFVSATPGDYELEQSEGVIVEQVVRPTGLLDPDIEVRPSDGQVDDLLDEIHEAVKNGGRALVTTLTKRMAEELAKFMAKVNVRCRYIHSEVETLDRVEILRDLRLGKFDVLVGVNLLREGLDLPEVSLVAILDADKEGFLRNVRSLTQIAGRAARNINGKVIMYADKVTDSMKRTIDETRRRRKKQEEYNNNHGISPETVFKTREDILSQSSVLNIRAEGGKPYVESEELTLAADPVVAYMGREELHRAVESTRSAMQAAAKEMDFIEAARLRDEMYAYEKLIKEKFN